MEAWLSGPPIPVSCEKPEGKPITCRAVSTDWGMTEAFLDEIKKQSTSGCLLCVLAEWLDEDWE
jgi:hypothetical protein